MAKKISAIVIPAVIDTTGIDKGINSIKTKLSGVRGSIGTRNSGTGGVGGGGNFGAGLPHYGGSAIATGAAAGIGAGFVGRSAVNSVNMGIPGWTQRLKALSLRQQELVISNEAGKNNFISHQVLQSGIRMEERGKKMQFSAGALGMAPTVNAAGTAFVAGKVNKELREKGEALSKRGLARAYFSQRELRGPGNLRSAFENFASSGGAGKMAGIGLIGATIANAEFTRKSFTQGGIKANFSDLSNLEGNPFMYEKAAAIKRRTYGPTGVPTFAQALVLGADAQSAGSGAAEGVASATDRLIAGAGIIQGARVEVAAQALIGTFRAVNNGAHWVVQNLKNIFN